MPSEHGALTPTNEADIKTLAQLDSFTGCLCALYKAHDSLVGLVSFHKSQLKNAKVVSYQKSRNVNENKDTFDTMM